MKVFWCIALAVGIAACKSVDQPKAKSLFDTRWVLKEMNNMPVMTPAGGKEIYLQLTQENGENRVTGFGGCNGLGGGFTLDGSVIDFRIITTKMYCDRMEAENFVTQRLDDANHFKINDNKLEFYQDDTFLIRFVAE